MLQAIDLSQKIKIWTQVSLAQKPNFSYDPEIIKCHSHIPLLLGIRMGKSQTFNEDPDNFQFKDPGFFPNFYFRIRLQSTHSRELFLFFCAPSSVTSSFHLLSLRTFRIKHHNWLLWCPLGCMGSGVWKQLPWVPCWLTSSSPSARSKGRAKGTMIPWNPGRAHISAVSPLCSLKSLLVLRQGREFWLVEAPAKYKAVYYYLIFTTSTSNIGILYEGEETVVHRGDTQGITAGEWGFGAGLCLTPDLRFFCCVSQIVNSYRESAKVLYFLAPLLCILGVVILIYFACN